MRDLVFYNVGCHEPKGMRRLAVPLRRMLRRLLRPIFLRQVELFQHLCDRLDEDERTIHGVRNEVNALADQMHTTLAFGWDYVAMVRRLAVLEEQVAALTGKGAIEAVETRPLILFPGFETAGTTPADLSRDQETRSRVC